MGCLAQTRTGQAAGSVYRVTRVVITGQFADDVCFRAWVDAQPGVSLVSWREEPPNNRWYVWLQEGPVTLPTDCQLTLMTSNGRNGWATMAEARAVLNAGVDKAAAVDVMVEQANEAALDPANWLDDGDGDKSEWGWLKWAAGGALVVGGIWGIAKLVRG